MMPYKWMTKAYLDSIEKVEIKHETEKFVVLDVRGKERRMAKATSNEWFHDSWEEARAHLLGMYENQARQFERLAQGAKQSAERLRNMEPPE